MSDSLLISPNNSTHKGKERFSKLVKLSEAILMHPRSLSENGKRLELIDKNIAYIDRIESLKLAKLETMNLS